MFLREGKKSKTREGKTEIDVAGGPPPDSSIPAVAFPHMTPIHRRAIAAPVYGAKPDKEDQLSQMHHHQERRGGALLGTRFCVVAIPCEGPEAVQPGERLVDGKVYTFWWRSVFYYVAPKDKKAYARKSWNRQLVKIADQELQKLVQGVGEPGTDFYGDAQVTRWLGRRLTDVEADWLVKYAEPPAPRRSKSA